jgi:hypothetical protein
LHHELPATTSNYLSESNLFGAQRGLRCGKIYIIDAPGEQQEYFNDTQRDDGLTANCPATKIAKPGIIVNIGEPL